MSYPSGNGEREMEAGRHPVTDGEHVTARHVLVVEDDALTALGIEDMLRALGFQNIAVAGNLSAAREAIAGGRVGLAVLDVSLPDGMVFPAADLLRRDSVPFVFCTGRTAREFPPEWSVYPIVAKPAGTAALRQALLQAGVALPLPESRGPDA